MSKGFRFFLVLMMLLIAGLFFYPTIQWYFFTSNTNKEKAIGSRDTIRHYAYNMAQQKFKELYSLMEKGLDAPVDPEFSVLVKLIKEQNTDNKQVLPAKFTYREIADYLLKDDIIEALHLQYYNEVMAIKKLRDSIVTPGLDLQGGIRIMIRAKFEVKNAELKEAKQGELGDDDKKLIMTDVLAIIRERVDKFGVAEPLIRQMGDDRIIVELPGAADPERVGQIIQGEGRLNFHLVDEEGNTKFRQFMATHPEPYLENDGVTPTYPELQDMLGINLILRRVVQKDKFEMDQPTGYVVLKREIGLSGGYIMDAKVSYNPNTNTPYVTFQLTGKGGSLFYDLTKNNVNKVLAIVLDNQVRTSATIREAIQDQVQVSGFNIDQANDLKLVLKTGSLPVPLELVNQEAIGAFMGAQAISQGLNSVILGVFLVIAFMIAYYKGSGVIATFALLVNFFLMSAILAVFNFTLTLPSIAGFILTVGMAVDANVIIFERIKEEYRIGKTRTASIQAGFGKALSTILDANITTVIAAITLAWFGKGPIRGFAVVLATGIVTSMISALFVSRLVFDVNTDILKSTELSISWRGSK